MSAPAIILVVFGTRPEALKLVGHEIADEA